MSNKRAAYKGGRRFVLGSPYPFPKDQAEIERLLDQHDLLKAAFGGNYLAPIQDMQVEAVLDIGCGTGKWSIEVANDYPGARVVGLDIDTMPAHLAHLRQEGQVPDNFEYVEGDALKPFPFPDHTFSFTYARLAGAFVPVARWPQVVGEMARVTKPGGYIELVEGTVPSCDSKAYRILARAATYLGGQRGLDLEIPFHMVGYLRGAGLVELQERRLILGNTAQEGKILFQDMFTAMSHLEKIVVGRQLLSAQDFQQALGDWEREMTQSPQPPKLTLPFTVVWGRRS